MVVMIAVIVGAVMMVAMTAVLASGIRAPFRLEWRFDRGHLGSKGRHKGRQKLFHRLVAAYPQPPLMQLRKNMPVAEMPGEPRHAGNVGRAHFQKRLRPRDDFDQPPVVENETIVGREAFGLCDRDLNRRTFEAGQDTVRRPALIVIEQQCIGDRTGAFLSRTQDRDSTQHSVEAFRPVAFAMQIRRNRRRASL